MTWIRTVSAFTLYLCCTSIEYSLQVQIWDVGNDQSAGYLDDQIYKNAAGAVIVCKLDSADCIEGLDYWQNRLHQVAVHWLQMNNERTMLSGTDHERPLMAHGPCTA